MDPGDASVKLSKREREIASLAAGGFENKEIAARLGLSPKTVANTLGSAYEKLGISSRKQLALKLGIDYPGPPIPMAEWSSAQPPDVALGEVFGANVEPSDWWLPRPPRARWRPLIILAFAAGAAVLTIGIVVIIGAGMSLTAGQAPPEAIRALNN